MWQTIKKVYVWTNQVRPVEAPTPIFDFGDWTNSEWTTFGREWTVTKSSSQITFSNSSNFSQNYLSQFEIDWTKDFLLEFTANIPNTTASFHYLWVWTRNDNFWIFLVGTSYRTGERNYICTKTPDLDWVNSGEANNGTKDFFMRKVWTTLTIWWDGVVKCTDSNFTTTGTWYFGEQVYRDTLTLYTAKLTYL